jgi:monooxygenase
VILAGTLTTLAALGSTVTSTSDPTAAEHVDVLIVGAGLSGIGAAIHLQTEAPGSTYAILEARGSSGGTWDLFRFPGVRSDSDMYTLGYRFRPWTNAQAIAPGGDILQYLRETAAAYGVDKDIEYHCKVAGADWSSDDARWTVTVEHTETGEITQRTCGFLYLCSGYYRYDQGYTPTWPGQETFTGQIVHPQFWPADLDYAGQKVVIIGSGATAVTMVPAMAETAARVTMLQRSPSFILSMPGADPIADLLHKVLPEKQAFAAVRWKNARIGTAIYNLSRKYPARARNVLQNGAAKQLPAGYDTGKHFTPAYQPWDQRMCLVPDGDFFKSIKSGKADVVTDHIEAFTPTGIRLKSGAELEADVIVTATGLNLLPLGAITLTVDGEAVPVSQRMAYKAMMLEGVPNMAFAIGYTNASWTLKVDMVSSYMARIVALMKQKGYATVTPRPTSRMAKAPLIDMTSGYFERSRATLPLQGERVPWRVRQHYFKDSALFRGAVDEKELQFQRAPARMQPAS